MRKNEDINFKMSINSVKSIPFEKYEKNFTFVVNGKEYQTSRIVADILSPLIRDGHMIDETRNTFYLNIDVDNLEFDFIDIFSLVSFEPKKINKDQLKYYIAIFYQLGNLDAIHQLFPQYQQEITFENVFELIHTKQNYFKYEQASKIHQKNSYEFEINDTTFSELYQKEIEFISSHFSEVDQEEIKKLDGSFIEKIIENKNLQLEDEDSLIKIVNKLYSKDDRYSFLYEYVDFLNVSKEEIDNFYQIFDVSDINSHIWKSVMNRVLDKDGKRKSKEKIEDGLAFKYERGKEFNGIVKYLTQKTGGNIHDNGTIEVTSNSTLNDSLYLAKNLLDFNERAHYQASHEDTWVCFDFKSRKVKITNYSIKSYKSSSGHLKSWDINVSNDGVNWIRIDERRNCSTLNGSGFTGTFDVQPNDFSRYVRIHQTGKPWANGSRNLWLNYIEFYGFLQE